MTAALPHPAGEMRKPVAINGSVQLGGNAPFIASAGADLQVPLLGPDLRWQSPYPSPSSPDLPLLLPTPFAATPSLCDAGRVMRWPPPPWTSASSASTPAASRPSRNPSAAPGSAASAVRAASTAGRMSGRQGRCCRECPIIAMLASLEWGTVPLFLFFLLYIGQTDACRQTNKALTSPSIPLQAWFHIFAAPKHLSWWYG